MRTCHVSINRCATQELRSQKDKSLNCLKLAGQPDGNPDGPGIYENGYSVYINVGLHSEIAKNDSCAREAQPVLFLYIDVALHT